MQICKPGWLILNGTWTSSMNDSFWFSLTDSACRHWRRRSLAQWFQKYSSGSWLYHSNSHGERQAQKTLDLLMLWRFSPFFSGNPESHTDSLFLWDTVHSLFSSLNAKKTKHNMAIIAVSHTGSCSLVRSSECSGRAGYKYALWFYFSDRAKFKKPPKKVKIRMQNWNIFLWN